MRIGLASPRINGVGIGAFTPEQLVAMDLASYTVNMDYQVQQGIAPTPSQLAAILQQEADATCRNWPERCAGGDGGAAAVAAAVDQYTSAYNTAQDKAYYGAVNNTIALPSSYYTTSPNALDRVTPQQTNVNPATQQNVLAPPQPTNVVTTNAGQFTGTNDTAANPGINTKFNIGGVEIPLWGLIAGGIGVMLLMKGK